MAELGARVSTPAPPHAGTALLPGRDVDLKQVVRNGLLAGLSVCFVATIGMLVAFEQRVIVSTFTLDYVILVAIPMLFGSLAGKPPQQLEGFAPSPKGLRNIWAGALAGAIGGAEVGVY